MSSRLPGFFRLPLAERRRQIAELAALDADDLAALDGGLAEDCADDMIENVMGLERARITSSDGRNREVVRSPPRLRAARRDPVEPRGAFPEGAGQHAGMAYE